MSEYVCISCGKDLGPGVATVYHGKNCPNCGKRWEGPEGQRPWTPEAEGRLARATETAGTATPDASPALVGAASSPDRRA
jgi:hypothetical protein